MNWTLQQYKDYMTKQQGPKKNKYRAKKTVVDGITFDSMKEANYYCQLKILKAAGEIREFALQPKYELQPKFKKNGKTYQPIKYIADFLIVNNDGTTEVVDVKGMETKDFKLKKKMFEYKYPNLTLKVVK